MGWSAAWREEPPRSGVSRSPACAGDLLRAPALGGLLLFWADPNGPVVALHGDTTRAEFRDLVASLVPRVGPPA